LLLNCVLLRINIACRPDLELPVGPQAAWMLDTGVSPEGFHPGVATYESSTAPHCAHCCIFMATELLHNHLASLPNLDILIGQQPAWMLGPGFHLSDAAFTASKPAPKAA
jgi:hypothetical protein